MIVSSSSLSGERKIFDFCLVVGVFSSLPRSSSSSSSSLLLFSKQRELERLAWMARARELSLLVVSLLLLFLDD